jgi:rod shape determining protein RodA
MAMCSGNIIHFFVNIAMVVGFPTIESHYLSSPTEDRTLGFTILLFIFLKMDANKVNEW